MIEECNFKYKSMANEALCSKIEYKYASPRPPPICSGEENCILFQTYELLNLDISIDKLEKELEEMKEEGK